MAAMPDPNTIIIAIESIKVLKGVNGAPQPIEDIIAQQTGQESSPADNTPAQPVLKQVQTPVSQNAGSAPAMGTAMVQQPVNPAPEVSGSIGPFGWIGIAFLGCLIFACATNIYLRCQKKSFDEPISKDELKKFAPGVVEGSN